MSLILTVLSTSPSKKLLNTDVDENTETDFTDSYALGRPHSESPTESAVSFQRPTHVAVIEPLNPSYHDMATLHSNPSPIPFKPDYNSDSERRDSFDSDKKGIQGKLKGFGRAAKFTPGCHTNELKHTMIDFGETTTAHGIPMILPMFEELLGKLNNTQLTQLTLLWAPLTQIEVDITCTTIMLEFESAPFPAITICNMNPFKNHLARSVPEISETLEAFHQAVTYSNNANNEIQKRRRRDIKQGKYRSVQYEPVYSACNCVKGPDHECLGNDSVPPDLESACICNLDRNDGSTWPCYSTSTWVETICPECNDIGYCNVPNSTGNDSVPCVCQVKMGYCVLRSEARLKRVWEFRGKKMPPANSPFRSDFLAHLKKLGYGNMTDQVAITTKAKEK
ncbi:unnamed protein product [Haemonchus placei]|uniref:Uncharacterized protein n=1 Tax=Haemonchus placei TaxID=6290 RepID=A0A0N4X2V4_HAEPC|nr:unnamed protein product [Haemonchus placei]